MDQYGILSATSSEDWATAGTLSGTLSLTGYGARMFWYPALAAFRAGEIADFTQDFRIAYNVAPPHEWDNANIGPGSVAFGLNTTASGYFSVATGTFSIASSYGSVAMGRGVSASGGDSTASGMYTSASGYTSFATGAYSTASGYYSVAMGGYDGAFSRGSVSIGWQTTASGLYSEAFGNETASSSYGAVVLGSFNNDVSETGGTPSSTTWIATDPIFEVGNGQLSAQGYPAFSNALVVYKNGDVTAQGVITASPGGDIPMYTGN